MEKDNLRIGDVIWAKLHGENHVQRGVRPVVIIQNDTGNHYSPTIQVVPMTSNCARKMLPTHVRIPAGVSGLTKNSTVKCEGVCVVDKADILGYIGHLPDEYMASISIAVIISMPLLKYLTIEQVNAMYQQVRLS